MKECDSLEIDNRPKIAAASVRCLQLWPNFRVFTLEKVENSLKLPAAIQLSYKVEIWMPYKAFCSCVYLRLL